MLIKKIQNVIEIGGICGLMVYAYIVMSYWGNHPELSQMGIHQHFQKYNISIVCIVVFYIFIKEFIIKDK